MRLFWLDAQGQGAGARGAGGGPGPAAGWERCDRVALLGMGLVGRAVAEALRRGGVAGAEDLPLAWADAARRRAELEALQAILTCDGGQPVRREVIWAAGRAGFAATEQDAAQEMAAWTDVAAMVARLAERDGGAGLTLHCISSAGALFEGQRCVGPTAVARPLRPYARLKLAQEEAATALAEQGVRVRVYRLASVFGSIRHGSRLGLVSTLLLNALRGRVTTLVGSWATLRDYVWADDVGAYVARQVRGGAADGRFRSVILASGKPSSLLEVTTLVQRVLGRPVYVRLAAQADNTRDTTFHPRALPAGFAATDLPTAVRQVHHEVTRQGTAFDPTWE